jgi:hypothetical protein
MTYDVRAAVRRRSARRDFFSQVTTVGIVATAIVATVFAAYGFLSP